MLRRQVDDELKAVYERIFARELLARDELCATYPMFTEAALVAMNKATGSSEAIRRWRREGRIFGVRYQGEDRYPAFQFENGMPKSVIANILEHLSPTDPAAQSNPDLEPPYSEWATAFWFAAANGWLEGEVPIELIDVEPFAVVTAASHAREKISD
jgi:hypothetical protein